jgi:hypothetical protein
MGCGNQLTLGGCEGHGRLALLLDRARDRCDLGRRRPAAAADDAGAERAGLRRELREVLGRRVRVDDAAAGEAGEPDVRERGERPSVPHRLERSERRVQAGAVVGPDGGQVVIRQALDRVPGGDPAERLRVLVEGEHGHDREARDALDGLDRGGQLVQVEEGLDHEEVDAAAVEELRLLGEEGTALGLVESFSERADRAGDIDVVARDLTRLPGQLDACLVDRGDFFFEEPGAQLVPVGAKRVGLDQLRPGGDEARVQ